MRALTTSYAPVCADGDLPILIERTRTYALLFSVSLA